MSRYDAMYRAFPGMAAAFDAAVGEARALDHPGPDLPDGWVNEWVSLNGFYLPDQFRSTASMGRTVPRNFVPTERTADLTIRRETVTNAYGSQPYTDADGYGYHRPLGQEFVASIEAKIPPTPGALPCPLWFRAYDQAAAQTHMAKGIDATGAKGPLGEIDVMEQWAHRWTGYTGKSEPHFQAALHHDYNGQPDSSVAVTAPYWRSRTASIENWNTWTVRKLRDSITFYCNGDAFTSFGPEIGPKWSQFAAIPAWYIRITHQVGLMRSGVVAYEPGPDFTEATMRVRNLRVATPSTVDQV